MKKWVALFIICFNASISPQTTISPQFSELNGIEDQQGQTHLFYRIYSSYSNDPFYTRNNDIYHFDLATEVDTIFLEDYSHEDPVMSFFRSVNDYIFWNDDFTKYIFCGSIGSWEPGPYIKRFDGDYIMLNYLCCEVNQLDIFSSDDSSLFAGGWIDDGCIQSIDGGFNWNPLVDSLQFLSLNPFDDNMLFLENSIGFLYRSTDRGNSFHLIDQLNQPAHSSSFLYDSDQLHIYRLFGNQTLRVSPNKGDPFSWETKYSSDSKILISIDESILGTIYLADKKNILVSSDYGNNFNIYKTLERKIVGIYKKSNSNKLYAATKYKIYEITPDTIQIIKQLQPVDYYNWYPLAIGNLWAYENYYYENGNHQFTGYSWNWVNDTKILPNGKEYFEIIWRYTNSMRDTQYIRLDSLNATLYGYSEESSEDLFYEALYAEIGDSICYEYNPVWNCQIVQSEEQFNIWGINTTKRELYPNYSGWVCNHSLVKGIGLLNNGCGDLTGFYSNLIGCVIDGVVYGDTTVFSVENERKPVVSEFKLYQNYPNPFNPTTRIKFIIPLNVKGQMSNVSLKVYDVLGNEIATLVNEEKPAGEYEVTFDATGLPSGVYFYQLKTVSFIESKKMVLMK